MPPELETPDRECGDMQTLVSITLHLLSALSASGCPRLAIMIKRHLDRLAAHPDTDPLVRITSTRLIEQYWAAAEVAAREVLRQAQTGSEPATRPASALVH